MTAFQQVGLDAASSTPTQLRELGERDFKRWAQLIKKNNITSD